MIPRKASSSRFNKLNMNFLITREEARKYKNEQDKNCQIFRNYSQQWREKNSLGGFFAGSELLSLSADTILISVRDSEHSLFLFCQYSLTEQEICREIFQEEKNVILFTNNPREKFCYVLLKDEQNIKKSLSLWAKRIKKN